MISKDYCSKKMDQAIKDLNQAKEFVLLQDYEEAENKLADALGNIADALDCLEYRGVLNYIAKSLGYLETANIPKDPNVTSNTASNNIDVKACEDSQTCTCQIDRAIDEIKDAKHYLCHSKRHKAVGELIDAIRYISKALKCINKQKIIKVDAGPDQDIMLPDVASLNGTVTVEGIPSTDLNILWSKVSGPGNVVFANAAQPVTTASFSEIGEYVLRLTASDSTRSSSDDVTIRVDAINRTYTSDADFNEGTKVNLSDKIPDQLQLDDTVQQQNFIWVAVSTKGTIVKINTDTGQIMGEYYTSPQGQPQDPSRTTVDLNGNVWGTNRAGNSVVCIGLEENGQWIDKNGNGKCDTSTGLGDIKPWTNEGNADTNGGVSTAVDECTIHYTRISSGGARHVSVNKDNNVWVSGTDNRIFDLIDGETGQIIRTEPSVGYGGYGGLIDGNGVIWSARPLLRWDTSKPLTGPNGVNWKGYDHDSYGLAIDSKGNVWNTSYSGNSIYKFAPDGTLIGVYSHGSNNAQGCVVDKNDDVWVAHSRDGGNNTVGHIKNDGTFVGNVVVGDGPTGVAVDSNGKIWATNYYSRNVSRIDPNAGPIGADGVTHIGEVDFTTVDLGGNLYNYSDMTGSTLIGAPKEGTWTVVFDSSRSGLEWGVIGWNGTIYNDGLIKVSVASSEDGSNFSALQIVNNQSDLSVPAGRYLKIIVLLKRSSDGKSPILTDITVGAKGYKLPIVVNHAPLVDAGPDANIAIDQQLELRGEVSDDCLPDGMPLNIAWSKESGPGDVIFDNSKGPVWVKVSFALTGEYQLKLTASDSAYTSSDSIRVVVTPKNLPPVVDAGPDQDIVLPDVAYLNGTVTDDGIPGVGLDILWSKVSGPGNVVFANPQQPITTASFSETGEYVLRLTASDSILSSSDDVIIRVDAVHRTYTTTADFNEGTKVNLSGTIPDQLELENPGEGTWTVVFDSSRSALEWGVIGWNGTVYNDGLIKASVASSEDGSNFSILQNVSNQSVLSVPAGRYLKIIVTLDSSSEGTSPIFTDITLGAKGYKLPPAVNHAPLVDAGPDTNITIDQQLLLRGAVSDDCLPDGMPLNIAWSKESGPGEVVFENFLGAAWVKASFQTTGEYQLRLTASDSASTSSDFIKVTVDPAPPPHDYERPIVQLSMEPEQVNVGETVNITVNASDNVGVVSTTLKVNGAPVELDDLGKATYISSSPGVFKAAASALDAAGNEGNASGEFMVITPGDTVPPVVSFSLPEEGSKLYLPTTIQGTATDENLVSYKLEYSEKDKNEFIEFATGTLSVVDGALGSFDPTQLRNGLYDVRLTAIDASGNKSSVIRIFQAEGEVKVGNFSMEFNDITLPVSGIPITVVRSYDSRNKSKGDFGIGWTISLQNIRLSESCVPGQNWEQIRIGGPIPTYYLTETKPHIITVIYPDGKTEEFSMVLNPDSNQITPIEETTVSFLAEPGTLSTLEALTDNQCLVSGSQGAVELMDYDTNTYNPDVYRLTTKSGTVIVINQNTGVSSITDNNGNTIDFTSSGIIHSSGKSIIFERDSQGRITAITDPVGNRMTYLYDFYGDLVEVTDQDGYTTRFTYNSFHQIVDIIDPRGIRPARNIYDDAGKLVAQIDQEGNRIEYTHDLDGRQEIIKDRLGNVAVMIYDERGNVLQNTDKLGNITAYTYDSQDNVLTKTDPLGNTTSYTYDDKNNKLSETDALGNSTQYSYNSRGQVLTIKYPGGETITKEYDASGNLTSDTNRLGKTTSYNYDTKGNLTSFTGPMGENTQYTYDQNGFMTSETSSIGTLTIFTCDENGNQLEKSIISGSDTITTKYVYDSMNRLIEAVDANGYSIKTEYNSLGKKSAEIDEMGLRTEYQYDQFSNLVGIIYADSTQESYSYDAEGRRVTSTDRAGRTVIFQYDKEDRILKTLYPDNTYIENQYDAKGQLVSSADERGNTRLYAYDAVGHNLSVIDPLGNEAHYEYDENGNKIKMIDAKGNIIQYLYDAEHHLIKTIFPDGTFVTKEYDDSGRMTSKTDQAGKVTKFSYDSLGRQLSVTDALNNVTNYEYDGTDKCISQTDANGHKTQYQYDKVGNQVKKILPSGNEETFSYDPSGNLISKTDFNGNTITFEYDVNGWMTKKSYADGTFEAYTYTQTGKRSSAIDSSGTTTYQYDYRDRLIKQINPDGTSISYTYDEVGNCISLTIPSGTTNCTYDYLNRLSTVTDPLGNVTSYTYDDVGNQSSVILANGITTAYAYDSLNRLTGMISSTSGGDTLASYTYTLGPSGNRTKVMENTGRTVDYTYDDTYKLTEEKVNDPLTGTRMSSYTYDKVGNRLSSTINGITTFYTYDDNDRLLTEGGYIYAYDNNGNTLSKSGSGETTNYSYDYNNRLIKVTAPSGQVEELVYNVDGIKVQKKINTTQIVNYLVDSNRNYAEVLEERDGSGNIQAAYTFGNSMISQNRGADISYYLQDALGSTRLLTNELGNVNNKYTYDAFGVVTSSEGTIENDYLFVGEQYDSNVGFYYLRARYMNPATGRFITTDDYEGNRFEPLSLHKYLYANANPISYTDPSGYMTLSEQLQTLDIQIIVLSCITTGIEVMNFIERIMTVVDIANSVISVYNMITSGELRDIVDKIYMNPVGKFKKLFKAQFWEDASTDLLANSDRIIAGVLSRPDKIREFFTIIKKPDVAYVIFMPTDDKINYNFPLFPTGVPLMGKPLKLAFGNKDHKGRLIGFGAAPTKKEDNLFQIFRMDWHKDHGKSSNPVVYWKSPPFHYHVYNA